MLRRILLLLILSALPLSSYAQTPERKGDDKRTAALREAKSLLARAMRRIGEGMIDEAIVDIETATSLERQNVPRPARVRQRPLTPYETRHGMAQVAAVLADRPAVAQVLRGTEPPALWACRQFATACPYGLVNWDNAHPQLDHLGFLAEHHMASEEGPARVRVAQRDDHVWPAGRTRSFEEQWSDLCFELNNVANDAEFHTLNLAAHSGKVTREEYIQKAALLELSAAQETRLCYARIFLPWAKKAQFQTDPELWYLILIDGTTSMFTDRNRYPYVPWGGYYDRLRNPQGDG